MSRQSVSRPARPASQDDRSACSPPGLFGPGCHRQVLQRSSRIPINCTISSGTYIMRRRRLHARSGAGATGAGARICAAYRNRTPRKRTMHHSSTVEQITNRFDSGLGDWGLGVGGVVGGGVFGISSLVLYCRWAAGRCEQHSAAVRPPPCWAKCRDGEIECSGDMCLCTCQLLFCVRAAAATETAAMAALAAPLIISITQSDAGAYGCTRGRQARTARAGMSQSNRQGCGMSSASLSSVGAKSNTHSERRDGVENRTHTETASTPKSIVDGVLDIELRLAGVNFELR